MQVNILEAKNQLSKLVKAAAGGQEVIIASNGKPVARLVPVEGPRTLGRLGQAQARQGQGRWRRVQHCSRDADAEIARVIRRLVNENANPAKNASIDSFERA